MDQAGLDVTPPQPEQPQEQRERVDAGDVIECTGDAADCFDLGSSCDLPCELPDCDVPCDIDPGCF
jgi:hypothetical protein